MPPMADTKAKIPSIFKLFFYVFSTFFCVIRKFNIICICSSFVCIHKIHSVIMFLFVYIFPAFGKQQMRPFACLLRSRCAHKPTMSRLISAMHGGVVMCPCPCMALADTKQSTNKLMDEKRGVRDLKWRHDFVRVYEWSIGCSVCRYRYIAEW